jgi:hypothetical protein
VYSSINESKTEEYTQSNHFGEKKNGKPFNSLLECLRKELIRQRVGNNGGLEGRVGGRGETERMKKYTEIAQSQFKKGVDSTRVLKNNNTEKNYAKARKRESSGTRRRNHLY